MRRVVGITLLIASLPFAFFGLIDALEGGISMLVAGAILGVAHLVLQRKPAKSLWIPYLLAIVLAVATLAYAIAALEFTPGPTSLPVLVVVGNWLYRGAVAATLIGTIITMVQVIRGPSTSPSKSSAR